MIAIATVPRSGSRYTSLYGFLSGGMVCHEKTPMGRFGRANGLVGYLFVEWPDQPMGTIGREQQLFPSWLVTRRWQQVRHPLRCIASIPTAQRSAMRRMYTRLGIPAAVPIAQAAMLWLEWNQFIETFSEWTYRVEDLRPGTDVADRFRIEMDLPEEPLEIPRDMNTRPHEPLTWEWLQALVGKRLVRDIKELGRHYGYEIEP